MTTARDTALYWLAACAVALAIASAWHLDDQPSDLQAAQSVAASVIDAQRAARVAALEQRIAAAESGLPQHVVATSASTAVRPAP